MSKRKEDIDLRKQKIQNGGVSQLLEAANLEQKLLKITQLQKAERNVLFDY